ncbi:hypothetical protein [Bradyrhizobium sp. 170]|uniref:hypothetical protein n=1 Tax=Bradyrhizobium sp. 170 TaxID=2782641 RepID=UPI001FFEF6C8|nr:hypothetical protein [Bradyrhizobium sp. 170]UPK08514.1 hypothetical protein IVB05_16990 [Bradyrhizobium sp. 170]
MRDLMGVWVCRQAIFGMPHMRAVRHGRAIPRIDLLGRKGDISCQSVRLFPGLPVKHSMTVRPLREPLIVVRTVVASQQPIVIADFSVNVMKASSLGTDGRPIAATKTSEMQDEKLRILEVAGEILLRRQIRSTHSRERGSDLWRQCVDISGIPDLFLERAGARKRRRQHAGKAEQNHQGKKADNSSHRRSHLVTPRDPRAEL